MRIKRLLVVLWATLTAFGFVTAQTDLARAGQIEDALRAAVNEVALGVDLPGGTAHLAARQFVIGLYAERDFRPVWTGPAADELFGELNRGLAQGFQPADFNLPALYAMQDAAASGDPVAVAWFDIAASDAAARLAHHVIYGKVDPEKLNPEWNFGRQMLQMNPSVLFNIYADGAGFAALMHDVSLRAPQYGALVDALGRYRAIAAAGGWLPIPEGDVLKPGMTDPRVPLLRARLEAEGIAAQSDAGDPARYEGAIVEAVKQFQASHGLEDDGVIGAKTFGALNVPAEDRVDQLRISLERARWLMRGLDERFVLVNIAGARTYFVEQGKVVWTTRSVTGAEYRQTPVFRDEIRYLEVNPTWTVPQSILRQDKLPLIRKDIGYLARNNYSVVNSNGDRLDPASVDWSSDNPGVTLVQAPGPDNALGRIKFMFPNKYSVYLHDTNNPELFQRNERNLSSGCIRLEDPFGLADRLMAGAPDWSRERLQATLDSGMTTRINLPEPVPVLLTYWTAWVENGEVQFREDLYGRDAPILAALNRN